MFSVFKKAINTPDIRKKLFITLFIVFLYRVVSHIPLPNIDRASLQSLFDSSSLLGLIDVFSGGSLSRLSVGALGVGPYITASIFMQVLVFVVPKLEELQKEGSFGAEKINKYTKLLTLPFALVQSVSIYTLFARQGVFSNTDILTVVTSVLVLTAGAFIAMWLGDLITEQNIGQGISILVLVGILASVPQSASSLFIASSSGNIANILLFLFVAVLVVAGVVFVNEATRKIPISYAGTSDTAYRGDSFLPLRVNQAGVIPIIFAVSLVLMPSIAGSYLSTLPNANVSNIGFFLSQNFTPGGVYYNVLYFVLVFIFTFFYTAVTFNPEKVADDLKQRGGFIPGIRPGKATEEHLNKILTRITFVGALFLGFVAIIPSLAGALTGVSALTIGGTGVLIVVSVVLETLKKLESQVIMREYDHIVLN